MNTETLKTIGWWIIALSIISLAIWGMHRCSKQQSEKREAGRILAEKEYKDKLLSDQYVYKDINGVYHITNDCGMLNDIYWTSDEEEKRGNYSSQYINRSTIKDWHKFAAKHQLCSECFTPELINQLDSIRVNNIAPYLRGRERSASPLELQYQETADELYRDADEEYYNITSPHE